MTNLTFLIACAPYHRKLVQRAIDSVNAQSVPCDYLVYLDEELHGPAFGRNELLAQVETPFVSFLDADDWLHPAYAERVLAHWREGHYVYTDWMQDDDHKPAPDKPWCSGTWHPVTTLIPTAWAKAADGFDETFPAAEDTDFYLRLTTGGLCGLRLPEPLFYYGKEGIRARNFVDDTALYDSTMRTIGERYTGLVGCCGDKTVAETPAPNEPFEGAVLAMAVWGGNRQQRGFGTGMLYPRAGNGRRIYVHVADIEAAPEHWRRVEDEPATEIVVNSHNHVKKAVEVVQAEGIAEVATWLGQALFPHRQRPTPLEQAAAPAVVTPDFANVIRLARRAHG